MIETSDRRSLAGDAERHPITVVAHVLTSIAMAMCAVAVGLILLGALLQNAPAFLSGAVTLVAGVTLELRAKALTRHAVQAATVAAFVGSATPPAAAPPRRTEMSYPIERMES